MYKSQRSKWMIFLALALVILAACGPAATATPAPQATAGHRGARHPRPCAADV